MDFVLKGRGVRITEQVRTKATQKLSKLERVDPRAVRLVIEVISEKNPRQNGAKRVEGALELPRHTFRASAEAQDVDAALDELTRKLERQVREHRAKRKKRLLPGSNRLKSPRIGPEGVGPEPEE